jgi:hypothetical protein
MYDLFWPGFEWRRLSKSSFVSAWSYCRTYIILIRRLMGVNRCPNTKFEGIVQSSVSHVPWFWSVYCRVQRRKWRNHFTFHTSGNPEEEDDGYCGLASQCTNRSQQGCHMSSEYALFVFSAANRTKQQGRKHSIKATSIRLHMALLAAQSAHTVDDVKWPQCNFLEISTCCTIEQAGGGCDNL